MQEIQPQPECPGPRWHTTAVLPDVCACMQFRAQPDVITSITWDGFWKTSISSFAPRAGTDGTNSGIQSLGKGFQVILTLGDLCWSTSPFTCLCPLFSSQWPPVPVSLEQPLETQQTRAGLLNWFVTLNTINCVNRE